MSNGQDSRPSLLSLFPKDSLNQVICVLVHCRGCLIHYEHTSISEESSGNAQELLLSLAQILSILSDLFLQTKRHPLDHSRHVDMLQSIPDRLVGVLLIG
jgi:hypothetical protein